MKNNSVKPRLSCLYIYLTDECNLHCIHCWQSAPLKGSGKYSSLKFNDCKKFLDDTLKMGLKSVIFSGGEPLLNPELRNFAEYLNRNRIQMTIETNGILISDKKILNTILNYNVDCAISLDGVNSTTHNKQRGSANAFQKTIQSIDKLEKEKRFFQLIMAISKFNYDELIPNNQVRPLIGKIVPVF